MPRLVCKLSTCADTFASAISGFLRSLFRDQFFREDKWGRLLGLCKWRKALRGGAIERGVAYFGAARWHTGRRDRGVESSLLSVA